MNGRADRGCVVSRSCDEVGGRWAGPHLWLVRSRSVSGRRALGASAQLRLLQAVSKLTFRTPCGPACQVRHATHTREDLFEHVGFVVGDELDECATAVLGAIERVQSFQDARARGVRSKGCLALISHASRRPGVPGVKAGSRESLHLCEFSQRALADR